MKWLVTIAALAMLAACSPVLNKDYMNEGAREFRLSHLVETPEVFTGKLFILGGVIVETRLTEQSSQVEALFVPVDSYGSLRLDGRSEGRFLARYARVKGVLDPLIYKRGRQVTMAATFVEVKKGKIDEMEYHYPVFEIRQIHLWQEYYDYPWQMYPYSSYYPSPYYYPYSSWCHDPWGRPYLCPNYRPMMW